MAGTRSSARQAAQNSSSPQSAKASNGTKRKADDTTSPTANSKAKRGRASKAQATLEETMPDADNEDTNDSAPQQKPANGDDAQEDGDGESRFQRPEGCWGWFDADHVSSTETSNGSKDDAEKHGSTTMEHGEPFKGKNEHGEDKSDPEKALKDSRGQGGANALDKVQASEEDAGKTSTKEDQEDGEAEASTNEKAIEEDKQREKAQPSNVLEKGIIYFVTRGRVGTHDPNSPQDLQRSYFVLRPLPTGAKITDGAVQDMKNARLFALPKKVWPKSGRDRFMAFVEKTNASVSELKTELMEGSSYSTKTTGTNQTPNAALIGEGVYSITRTGGGQGTTHLAYMLTIPTELGEVQTDVGISDKGSFVISLKNPESSGPANAQLPQGPDWPKEYTEEFGGRGWMPPEPKHLDYANSQILLIGENFENSKNLEANPKDEQDGQKETPEEELVKLEDEDEERIKNLKGDETVFTDLGLSKKEYGLMTTW